MSAAERILALATEAAEVAPAYADGSGLSYRFVVIEGNARYLCAHAVELAAVYVLDAIEDEGEIEPLVGDWCARVEYEAPPLSRELAGADLGPKGGEGDGRRAEGLAAIA